MKNLVFISMFLIAVAANAQSHTFEFYRDVHIDSRWENFVCKGQIDSALAKKTDCYRVSYDAQKRIETIRYEKIGKWKVDKNNLSAVQIYYSDSIEKRFYTYPTEANIKNRTVKLVLNENKKPISLINYDENENLIKDRNRVVRYERILDENDYVIEAHFYDENGNRCKNYNDDFFYRYKWNSDSHYYLPELTYYDENGNLHDGERGYSIIQSTFDKNNQNLIERKYFNAKNQFTLNKTGYAIVKCYYYDNGLLKTIVYFGTDKLLINNKDGYCKIEYKYNKYGNVIQKDWYRQGSSRHTEVIYQLDKNQHFVKKTEQFKRNKL